ncbi:MAG: UDP-N-acetylglucosamine 2-epimerase [Oscillospiraceae bacterium]|jgi:UDP-N-acetylglucosamine 2-epimerase (non-hydrolysing)|nr:UDP-N-acetylglucosamine 2-epimerase [Oscillospiraceae bacterium]
MRRLKVMLVFGTRPDAIKMAPLLFACQKDPRLETIVCVTAQHREILDDVLAQFNITPDFDLNIMQENQTLTDITTRVLSGMGSILTHIKPDVLLVHGDTTTALSAGLSAFYHQIPIGHVEAGLRTGNLSSPYPEEMNRTLLGDLSTLHFAPTEQNRQNLLHQNVGGKIYVTGNTAIDVLRYTVRSDYRFTQPLLNQMDYSRRMILLTTHRRENLSGGISNIFAAVNKLILTYPDVEVLFPVHPNPVVRNLAKAAFRNSPRVHLLKPLNVLDMHNLINRCYMVMTDSGGLQEEAPSLNKPVLVLRQETERIEALCAGTAMLAGVSQDSVFSCAARLLSDQQLYKKMAGVANPYGDGFASERIINALIMAFSDTSVPLDAPLYVPAQKVLSGNAVLG